MEVIKEVGPYMGVAAFLGLAVLALLYFAQARDVRRLRENAEFLVEGDVPAGDLGGREPMPTATAVAEAEPEEAARVAAAGAPNDAEAYRRAELARQAAERRQRFEQRRGSGGRARNLFGELPSTAVMVVGAIILLAGIGFGASRLLGGDDEGSGNGGTGSKLACPPPQTKVAVLNGTAEAGLAANFASDLKNAGYDRGPVTNTEDPFETSVVMFDNASQDCAPEVANTAGLPEAPAEPMSQAITSIAEGSAVAVVLGEDIGGGDASSDDTAATGDSTSAGAEDSSLSEESTSPDTLGE